MFYNPHKKIALFFLGLTIFLFVLILIFFFLKEEKMFISVNPRQEKSLLEKTIRVPHDLDGEIIEINFTEEKTFSPKAGLNIESVARGNVEITNTTDRNFTFVKATRLLSPDNILFRLEQQTFIPAKGKITASVYADQVGAASEIEPTRFTFPGLSAPLQTQIYAESKEKMKSGVKIVGLVTENEVEAAKKNIEEIANKKAEELIQNKIKEKELALTDWKIILADKGLTIDSDAKIGEESEEFTLKAKLKVVLLLFKESELFELIKKIVQENISADKKLKNIDLDTLKYEVEKINLTDKTIDLTLQAKFSTIITEDSPIFDLTKIKTMSPQEIKVFLEQYKEIEKVKIKFDPFWKTKTPEKNELINIKIEDRK